MTARRRVTPARVRFAISGDADATPGPNGKPGFNHYETYGRMADERNDFNINLGDTIYSDSELSGSKPALTVPAKWQKYRYGLALPNLRALRAIAGLYSHPDDHEFVNDFSVPEVGKPRCTGRASKRSPTTRLSPGAGERASTGPSAGGRISSSSCWTSARFGARRSRSSARNDLAPPLPHAVRAAFATLIPSLAAPVSQACLHAIAIRRGRCSAALRKPPS